MRTHEDRLLAEMTDFAAELARDVAGRAKEAASVDDVERFAGVFDRMSRSMRLSIGLRRRLKREEAREAAQHRAQAVDLRRSRLGARLRSEIGDSDAGFSDRLELERELDARLAEDALYQGFTDLPLDAAISKLRARLGLPDPSPGQCPIDDDLPIAATNIPAHPSGLQPPHPTTSGAEQLEREGLRAGPS